MTRYGIDKIEGIGASFSEKLHSCGIKTTADLLEFCAEQSGRKSLAGQSGIDEEKILRWTNMADLMRIRGVGEEYSELLEAAGVDTVKELRHRNAENLFKAMQEVNTEKHLVRQTPAFKSVQKWVEQAKELDPMLTY